MKTLKIYESPVLEQLQVELQNGFAATTEIFGNGNTITDGWGDDDE